MRHSSTVGILPAIAGALIGYNSWRAARRGRLSAPTGAAVTPRHSRVRGWAAVAIGAGLCPPHSPLGQVASSRAIAWPDVAPLASRLQAAGLRRRTHLGRYVERTHRENLRNACARATSTTSSSTCCSRPASRRFRPSSPRSAPAPSSSRSTRAQRDELPEQRRSSMCRAGASRSPLADRRVRYEPSTSLETMPG